MLSATVRMAIFRAEYRVIKGFIGSTKPDIISIYQRFRFGDLLAKSSITSDFAQPQDAVVVFLSWSESHGSWYPKFCKTGERLH